MCTFICTIDEPNVEPKKKKHRISDDDGEKSQHSVQGTVTKLLYMYMYEQIQNTHQKFTIFSMVNCHY